MKKSRTLSHITVGTTSGTFCMVEGPSPCRKKDFFMQVVVFTLKIRGFFHLQSASVFLNEKSRSVGMIHQNLDASYSPNENPDAIGNLGIR